MRKPLPLVFWLVFLGSSVLMKFFVVRYIQVYDH